MNKIRKYDDIVIGFGKGGKTIAGALANAGHKVAVIEKSQKMYGGTCINVGCIPTKSLVHSAEIAAIGCEEKDAAYSAAMERKRALVEKLREKNYDKLADNPNITVIDGTASFVSSHEIQVQTAEELLLLKGDRFYINTGPLRLFRPFQVWQRILMCIPVKRCLI